MTHNCEVVGSNTHRRETTIIHHLFESKSKIIGHENQPGIVECAVILQMGG